MYCHRKLSGRVAAAPSLPSAVAPAVVCKDLHAVPHASGLVTTLNSCTGRPNCATFLKTFLTTSKAAAAGDLAASKNTAVEGAAHAPGVAISPATAYVYVCGPAGMTAAVHRELTALVGTGKYAVSLHDINYAL
jgi:hypothetical protein